MKNVNFISVLLEKLRSFRDYLKKIEEKNTKGKNENGTPYDRGRPYDPRF